MIREKENEIQLLARIKRLERIVRVGTVSSVDIENYTARVAFPAAGDIISAELIVMRNVPFVTIEKWADDEKWKLDAEYATVDRSIGIGETYDKAFPDVIQNEIRLDYLCPAHGIDETKVHREIVRIRPWLPYIDQTVLCLYLPFGKYQGFVLGGLNG